MSNQPSPSPCPAVRSIRVGTRGSALAQWQTNHIVAALKRLQPDLQLEIRIIKTEGDKDQVRPLAELGGMGVFTKAIEDALLAHEIDLAVHSLKDLPTEIAKDLTIAAIPQREDPRDCIVSRHKVGLLQLPAGARIGTSSARRTAQVRALRPEVQIVPLRGNVDTRMRKAQSREYDGVILAAAGITRLGRANEITEYLSLDAVLPDPGQGALAVQIRAEDTVLASLVAQLDHAPTRAAVSAERAFLRGLGGGCRMPIGAYGEMRDGKLFLKGVWATGDGSDPVAQMRRGEISGDPQAADALGMRLAEQLKSGSGAKADLSPPPPSSLLSPSGVNDLKGKGEPVPLSSPQSPGQVGEGERSAPLQGKRILVTRARGQAEPLIEKIRALGGEPVPFPTIDFAPLDDFSELDTALDRAASFDWIVFTSANGVRYVTERLRALGSEPREAFQKKEGPSPKLAAIGPATARALTGLGLQVDFVPTKFLGEQIALELPVARGASALLLRADLASDVLARVLMERGVYVKDVDAYRTIVPEASELDLQGMDAVTFTSSSTVRNFLEMVNGGLAALSRVTIFCIGPVTANTAQEVGLRAAAVASEHTIDGLVAAMVEYYREGQQDA